MPGKRSRRVERTVLVDATPDELFARLDDQARLAEHMTRPSPTMRGASAAHGLPVARGRAVGLRLSLDEEVTERDPPRRKAWRTVGQPKLVVLAGYQMGFAIEPEAQGSRLTVWIDYAPGTRGIGLWAPSVGEMYARWCVDEMADDAVATFSKVAPCGAEVRCPLR